MNSYWLESCPLHKLSSQMATDCDIAIIGSGLAGISAAYWLLQEGFSNIQIIDDTPEKAASFRNSGHLIYGTCEPAQSLVSRLGKDKTKTVLEFSKYCLEQIQTSINSLAISCDYLESDYLMLATTESELDQLREESSLYQEFGFQSNVLTDQQCAILGFKNCKGAHSISKSRSAHPVKFVNALIAHLQGKGVRINRSNRVISYESSASGIEIEIEWGDEKNKPRKRFTLQCQAMVLASNAFSAQFSDWAKARITPFRGQMLYTSPMRRPIPFVGPHAFEGGFSYGLTLPNNCLLIGGWRNHVEGAEQGDFDFNISDTISKGLKELVKNHYTIDEEINWQKPWTGIMGTSPNGMPFVGSHEDPRIFHICGFSGHGFSLAHGSARILSKAMAGNLTGKELEYQRMCN